MRALLYAAVAQELGAPISALNAPGVFPCDYALGRKTRAEIQRVITKRVQAVVGDYEYPAKCRLAAANDKLLPHEKHKKRRYQGKAEGEFECLYCKKRFKSEKYLDLHMERHHSTEVNGTTCLANFCDVFGTCPGGAFAKGKECNATRAIAAKHLCNDIMLECFPATSTAKALLAEMRRSLCGMLDCNARSMEGEEKDQRHTDLVVVIVLFCFIVLFGAGSMLVIYENGDEVLMWLNSLSAGTIFGENVARVTRALVRQRSTLQKKMSSGTPAKPQKYRGI
jgi:hypothetical protein